MTAAPGHIAFLGFGEAARAFQGTLAAQAPGLRFSSHDIKLRGEGAAEMRAAMEAAGVAACDEAAGLARADWIVSAVTADQSLIAVEPLLGSLGEGQLLVDINSVSPGRKRETAARVAERGARYLDMAVMAPVHPRGHRTPVMVAGADIDALVPILMTLDFQWKKAGDTPGEATAIKMVRSVFVKGLEAITVEALLAAERSGCFEEILASLSSSYPGLGWPGIGSYHFDRTLVHGTRRAAEMRESAATLDELGLHGALAAAIAGVQEAQGRVGRGPLDAGDLRSVVAAALAARVGDGG